MKRLSPRRREILQLTAEGLTGREVGHRLFITARTVEHSLTGARKVLGAKNTTHAVYLMESQRARRLEALLVQILQELESEILVIPEVDRRDRAVFRAIARWRQLLEAAR